MAERWQTSEGRTAAVFFRDTTGAPVTGLTPTATSAFKDGTAGAPAATVTEVGNGFYRIGFASAPTKDVLVRVDGGGTLTTTRYIALEVPVGGYVDSIDALISSRATAAAVTALSSAITALGSPAQASALTAVQADTDALQLDTATLLARLTSARAAAMDFLAQLDPGLANRIARQSDVQVTVTGTTRGQVDVA